MLIQLTTMSENQNGPNRPRKDHPEKDTIFKIAPGAKTPLEEEPPTTKVESEVSSKATQARTLQCQRPNREKEKKIEWTYELNQDLYKCYKEADRDTLGYMARIKGLLDEHHPTLPEVSSKYLGTQVTWIISKKLIRETQGDDHQNSASSNAPQLEVNQPSGNERESFGGEDPTELEATIEPSTGTPAKEENPEQLNNIELDIPEEIQHWLEEKWNENFRKYNETNIPQQNYQTKFHAKVTDQEWTLINNIVERKIKKLELNGELSLWDINVAHYITAITVTGGKEILARIQKDKKHQNQAGWYRLKLELLL